ncbi:uncharacterized protein PHALS_00506 [Plasmopara halstedii]|uniref:Uncharacterized protein n=1 Tax=Plasmopara halstedii TaxID=4781 RepID=A0A0P1A6F4_PLAHL|nr:uncharacterized protein PHALS_00506 [Plasmopara halstedii]CEG36184.1 hypothetical protein PHALS_00506 [Plasmopara halstedii]|eukprot:XP_024572553.1 hypothetical protein PHALS_00506 [Plasmopara halstedii]
MMNVLYMKEVQVDIGSREIAQSKLDNKIARAALTRTTFGFTVMIQRCKSHSVFGMNADSV